MLARLAGLRSARKQRLLGWPNLARATEVRRLNAARRRKGRQLVEGLRLERERRARELPVDLHALARAQLARLQAERTDAKPRRERETKPSGCLRGMTLMEARRRGLLSR